MDSYLPFPNNDEIFCYSLVFHMRKGNAAGPLRESQNRRLNALEGATSANLGGVEYRSTS